MIMFEENENSAKHNYSPKIRKRNIYKQSNNNKKKFNI